MIKLLQEQASMTTNLCNQTNRTDELLKANREINDSRLELNHIKQVANELSEKHGRPYVVKFYLFDKK